MNDPCRTGVRCVTGTRAAVAPVTLAAATLVGAAPVDAVGVLVTAGCVVRALVNVCNGQHTSSGTGVMRVKTA